MTFRDVKQSVALALVCGVLVSFATGVIENSPGYSIVEATYYGFPLFWRVTITLQPDQYTFTNLAIDILFWILASFVGLIVVQKISSRIQTSP